MSAESRIDRVREAELPRFVAEALTAVGVDADQARISTADAQS